MNPQNQILILTGCDHNMIAIGQLTAANHRAYAIRHGYDFEQVTDYSPDTHPSWQKLQLVRDRLPGYSAVVWLDADTIITNPRKRIEAFTQHEQFALHVSTDWTHPLPEDEVKHFSMGNFIFVNCDVAYEIIDAALARSEWANTPLWEQQALQEEFRANIEIRPYVCIHPRRTLNAVPATTSTPGPEPWEPGDFLCHLTYLPNATREAMFWPYDLHGIHSTVPLLPDWHETVMCADIRHIACMQEILMSHKWESALEIGVWQGASTAAFMHALDAKQVGTYTACDVGIQEQFLAVVGDRKITTRQQASIEVLAEPTKYDLIFADGDHSIETVREEVRHLIRRQPRMIFAHDTTAEIVGFGGCEGPSYLHTALQQDGWMIITDSARRPGEKTERGLLVATKEPALWKIAQRAFAITCY